MVKYKHGCFRPKNFWNHVVSCEEPYEHSCQWNNHNCWKLYWNKVPGNCLNSKQQVEKHFLKFNSAAQSCPTFWNTMNHSNPGFPVHHQLPECPKPMSIESVMPSNHLILCRPLLLLPSVFPSIRVFSNESALHISWPKYWSFSSASVFPMGTQD